jgi:hypothetical protein
MSKTNLKDFTIEKNFIFSNNIYENLNSFFSFLVFRELDKNNKIFQNCLK